jgi:hypothetical protein
MAEYIKRTDAMNAVLVGDVDKDFPCMDIAARLHDIPAADVRPVVLCRDCVYWQKPQIRLNDGTYRDYEPGEYENGSFFGGVTVDVGINIGSFCAKYNTEHQNNIPQFMGENDFCSKGYKLREES